MFIYKTENAMGMDNLTDLTETKLFEAFRNFKITSLNNKDQMEEKEYAKEWVNDVDMRSYEYINFDPSPTPDKKTFNTFRGFHPITKTDYKPKEGVYNYLKVWNSIGQALCGGNAEHYKYFKSFLAQLIQQPHERVPISFLFKGKEGAGKNVFLNCIGKVIGDKHYITSSNANDFFGEHGEGFVNKLLVNMNEVELNKTKDIQGRMKEFISENKISVNPKNVRPYQINNYARLVLFSNKSNPIPLEVQGKDRRWVIFKTADDFLSDDYDSEFWSKIVKVFNSDDFIKALYDELKTMDISLVDWKNDRPITEAYKEMYKLFFPTEVIWLEHYLNNLKRYYDENQNSGEEEDRDFTTEKRRKGAVMYDKYKKYCVDKGFNGDASYQTNVKQFYNKLYELEVCINIVVGDDGGKELVFNPSQVLDILNKKYLNSHDDKPKVKGEGKSAGVLKFGLEDL
jgi:hypothetical protein